MQLVGWLMVALSHAAPPTSGESAAPEDYHVEARSYGTRPESEPPPYVRSLDESGVEALRRVDWVDLGVDFRTRFEYRQHDFARTVETIDAPILFRSRAYLGLKKVADPFRFAVELEDAHRTNTQFPKDDRDTNLVEPIQLMGELFFADALGAGRPISLRGGRMAFEQVDRRLLARNGWRNTTNTFQGARVLLNSKGSPWQVDLFALAPLERRLYALDRPVEGQWLYGAIATWRQWSPFVILQPHYLRLRQIRTERAPASDVHTAALRAYGLLAHRAFDYDVDVAYQFGQHQEGIRHDAFGFTIEVGYTVEAWSKLRVSTSYGHASGDRDPTDDVNNRLDRLFGFARPFSNNIYFQWENVRTPKLRLELEPERRLWLHAGYGLFWLDSPTDRWRSPGLRDPEGRSGTFLGHEIDGFARAKVMPRVDVNVGYAYFQPGEFPRSLGRLHSSHFVYFEVMMRLFG